MPGPLLAIESSTLVGSVAVGEGETLLAEVTLTSRRGGGGGTHSALLVPAIDYALELAGVERADLAGVVVGAGPGSFTGIRIAAATAKGIVHALGAPLFACSSLLVAAAPALRSGGAVCAMFDARGRDVFAACYSYDSRIRTPVAPTPMPLEDAIDHCRELAVDSIVGDAALRHREELERELRAAVVPAHFSHPRAAALLWLVTAEPESFRIEQAAAWEPDYLRPSGAERIAARRAAARTEEPA